VPTPNDITPAQASLIAAFVGAFTALAVMLVRDLVLERAKERRRLRRELIDRKLTEIYSPLWVGLGGEDGYLGHVLRDQELRRRLSAHFHLLSPELQDIVSRHLLVGRFKDNEFHVTTSDMQHLIEASPAVKQLLKAEIDRLRRDYENAE
jgi:hypothetical protein